MKNILLSVITILALCLNIKAQEHDLKVKLTGGSLSLYTSSLNLDAKSGNYIGFEFGYHYSFNSYLGVGSGVGFSFLNSELELNEYEYSNGLLNDSEGDPYNSLLYLDDWVECQDITLMEIPVVLTYQEQLSKDGKLNLFCDLGFRIGIPISSKYEVITGSYEDQGYYEQYDLLLKDIPGHFESDTNYAPAGEIDLKVAFMLTSSVGVKYIISDKLDLQGGFRFNTTLNDIKSSSSNLTTMSSDRSRTYEGLSNSDLTSDIRPLQIGFEIGVNIHL